MHYNEDKIYAVLIDKKGENYINYLLIFDIKTGKIIKKEEVKFFNKDALKRYDSKSSLYYNNENFVFLFNYLYDNIGISNGYILTKINKKTNEMFGIALKILKR